MNTIIRIMLVTIMRMLAITFIVTTMRMGNIRVIEAMNRAMIILIIIEIPTTIMTNMHRNQTKSHKNTYIKYTSQHSSTIQIP